MGENGTKTRFHAKLYSRGAIADSIEAYKEFGVFGLEKDGDYYNVTIDRILDEEYKNSLMDEFKNYVLYLTIAGTKKW